ncbi:hypothetical protein C8K36_1011119 [Rhodococcus sp. OK519]|uniref:hypothetical protein n=1 Tax=Rhodococcus sp. OK519 TaxID=2135729 RepID=UPI000D4D7D8F|nr:hypothetical protein C8K36_1011119 [Rhodococcus sp. OK519]
MTDYFAGPQELAEMMGEAWDVRKAADEFLELIAHPEKFTELQELAAESGTSAANNEWDQLSRSDMAQVREAIRAAADGDC